MPARLTLFQQQLIRETRQKTVDARMQIAGEIVDIAKSIAPVVSGAYRGGMAERGEDATVSVVDNDPTSIYKEYGTRRTPAHASLTATAMTFGRYTGMRPKRGRMT